MTASPRAPKPNPYLGPCPAHFGSIRTAQEQARYLRGSVDRHVDKAGQPVDEAGKTIYVLWIRSRTRLSRVATGTVENRAAMWTRAAENSRKTTDGNFPIRYSP